VKIRAMFLRALFVSGLALLPFAGAANADLGPLEPIADTHRALHASLGLPEPMIVRLLERGLPEPELPAVGLIAQRAHVPVTRVVDMRLRGMAYNDIALNLGPGPEIFYIPFERDPGPPYGKAWGYYKKFPRERWRAIHLSDAYVISSSNLLLVSRHYAVPVGRVVEMQRGGRSFASIHGDLYASSHSKSMKASYKPGHSSNAMKAGKGNKAAKSNKSKHQPPKSGKPQH
jgi:hypothetical protein